MGDFRVTGGAGPLPSAVVRQVPPATKNSAVSLGGDGKALSGVAGTLARLQGGVGLDEIPAAQWQGALGAIASLPAAQQATLADSLKKQGWQLQAQNGEVSLLGHSGAVTARPGTGELRVTVGQASTVYQGARAVETIAPTPDGKLAVQRNGRTEVWDPRTGQGAVDGKPLTAAPADRVPGEAPRKPWARPPANNLKEDPFADEHEPGYAERYDAAVVAAGGKVLEPTRIGGSQAAAYNCHSLATTGGQGNLADPFDMPYQPRWVNMPTFELASNFKQLRPDQRVHVGDVVVYAFNGVPQHTGVVTAVDADGNPSQVDSKWGAYGRFLHAPADVPRLFGEIAGFYRPDAK